MHVLGHVIMTVSQALHYNTVRRQLILAQEHVDAIQSEVLAKKQEALNAINFQSKAEQRKIQQASISMDHVTYANAL